MSNQQTLQQERAASAWKDVDGVRSAENEYGSLIRSLPAMIQSQGLAPSLVFLKAKKKPHHLEAYKHVSDWVMQQLNADARDLLEWVIHQDSYTYRQAAAEAIAYLTWLKRFAEAKGIGSEQMDD